MLVSQFTIASRVRVVPFHVRKILTSRTVIEIAALRSVQSRRAESGPKMKPWRAPRMKVLVMLSTSQCSAKNAEEEYSE